MSEIRVTSVVGENGGDRVGLTTGLTVGPLTGTTGIGATISHQGHAQFAGVCTATSFVGNGANLTGISASTGDTAPAFKAKLSSNQSAPSASTFTKLQFASEVFDTNSCFDTTNHRFTPNVGGYYMITLGFSYANGNYSEATSILQIRKNGGAPAEYGTSSRVGGFESRWGFNVSGVVQLNGSGDYVEGYIYGPSRAIDSGSETFFSGGLVRLT